MFSVTSSGVFSFNLKYYFTDIKLRVYIFGEVPCHSAFKMPESSVRSHSWKDHIL